MFPLLAASSYPARCRRTGLGKPYFVQTAKYRWERADNGAVMPCNRSAHSHMEKGACPFARTRLVHGGSQALPSQPGHEVLQDNRVGSRGLGQPVTCSGEDKGKLFAPSSFCTFIQGSGRSMYLLTHLERRKRYIKFPLN